MMENSLTADVRVVEVQDRVINMIDELSKEEIVRMVKTIPTIRGVINGNIAEYKFRNLIEMCGCFSDIRKPDDHDRTENKGDLVFSYKGRKVSVQLKSVQTNSVKVGKTGNLEAVVQNDGSDRRTVLLQNGHEVEATNYRFGDYDILAVPMKPFEDSWKFAYKLNRDCSHTTSKKFSQEDSQYLMNTTEKISYPLDDSWSYDLIEMIARLDSNPSGVQSKPKKIEQMDLFEV